MGQFDGSFNQGFFSGLAWSGGENTGSAMLCKGFKGLVDYRGIFAPLLYRRLEIVRNNGSWDTSIVLQQPAAAFCKIFFLLGQSCHYIGLLAEPQHSQKNLYGNMLTCLRIGDVKELARIVNEYFATSLVIKCIVRILRFMYSLKYALN